jgi:hypothetical protein
MDTLLRTLEAMGKAGVGISATGMPLLDRGGSRPFDFL